jgi:ATP synthase protein I
MPDPLPGEDPLLRAVTRQEERKLKARRERGRWSLWFGLGAMGVVGWSVAVPTVIGVLVGHWLDAHHPGPLSWSLTLLVLGATMGGLNAWRWLRRQREATGPEEGAHDE